MTNMEDGGEKPSRHLNWARRHPWLVAYLVATALVALALFWIAGFFLKWSGLDQDGEARRPLRFPRDTAIAERIVTWVQEDGDCGGVYVELPREFSEFTSGGLASCSGETVFLPQWSGIPDDAGGYFYSPSESPEGWDMWGMTCQGPVDLGDGWWKCGMGD